MIIEIEYRICNCVPGSMHDPSGVTRCGRSGRFAHPEKKLGKFWRQGEKRGGGKEKEKKWRKGKREKEKGEERKRDKEKRERRTGKRQGIKVEIKNCKGGNGEKNEQRPFFLFFLLITFENH